MNRLSTKGASISLGLTLAGVFVLCALAQTLDIGFRASHMWVNLFSAAEAGSAQLWIEGMLASLVFGALAGYLFAFFYNKFSR